MKTPIAVALAGVMAVSSMAFTSVDANAKPKWPHKPYHHHHQYHGGGNVGAGIVFGMVAGALASQAFAPNYYYNPYPRAYYPPAPPRYGYGYQASYNNAHVQWCLSRYKTYNPATNTYFRKVGVPAVCVSPF